MVGVGSLFGAFHCAAWSFHFPSDFEMTLWRSSSVQVLIALIVASYLYHLSRDIPEWISKLHRLLPRSWSVSQVRFHTFNCGMTVSISLYIMGRLSLIVLAFTQLRSLPQSAFRTVEWTTYIPHI
ncbi:hypothetical protein ARMSODRAFT_899862 [Armillaria solidipes]|uniref:Uncharacterized protein n=1 Tax=Armillaria solidipes TaxID=1076256 RepID=A0A2H3B584_9AGAR|nr:hypothetical protein ARMSODRAFT_899862 [Armillaria solidipes]